MKRKKLSEKFKSKKLKIKKPARLSQRLTGLAGEK
jgi:hypothetical protein